MNNGEEQKIALEGEKLTDLVNSNGWDVAKKMLEEKCSMLDSISAVFVEGKSAQDIAEEVKLRTSVVAIIRQWIVDVEGTANQIENNIGEKMKDLNPIIKTFE